VSVFTLTAHVLGKGLDEQFTMEDTDKAGLPFFSGCQYCHASLGPLQALPGKNGYIVGTCCYDQDEPSDVYLSVEEAAKALEMDQ